MIEPKAAPRDNVRPIMDAFTYKHFNRWCEIAIGGSGAERTREILLDVYETLDAADREYIENNGWGVLLQEAEDRGEL